MCYFYGLVVSFDPYSLTPLKSLWICINVGSAVGLHTSRSIYHVMTLLLVLSQCYCSGIICVEGVDRQTTEIGVTMESTVLLLQNFLS